MKSEVEKHFYAKSHSTCNFLNKINAGKRALFFWLLLRGVVRTDCNNNDKEEKYWCASQAT